MSEGGRWVEYVPLKDLRPHPKNPRTHKPEQLQESFERFGFTTPILTDGRTGLIAAGHGRWGLLTAMRALKAEPPDGVTVAGDDWLVPVTRGWESADDAEAEAYLIADNRQTELATWQEPELLDIVRDLPALTGVGYTEEDVAAMLKRAGEAPGHEVTVIENDYGERADRYRNKQLRSIIFDYPLAAYEFVATTAAELHAAYAVETHAQLFVAMLREFDVAHPETAGV